MGKKYVWVITLLILLNDVSVAMGKMDHEKYSSKKRNMARGGAVGAAKNAARYLVEVGGKRSNVVNVFELSGKGNSKWFAKVDMPRGNVPNYYLNVNKAITGVKDPHIPISAISAQAAGIVGYALKAINKIAPVLTTAAVALDISELSSIFMKDLRKGNFERTKKHVMTRTSAYAGGYAGAKAGASFGSTIFPGIGTLIGSIMGGVFGGIGGGIGGEVAADMLRL